MDILNEWRALPEFFRQTKVLFVISFVSANFAR